ncbi:FG-GAP-like repeat-containing protein [Marinoscillum furvescens]|uniref:Putative secreted protein (Por secretion system target) n=1 Tax=Marinoscillum furvescens DSM 4134 TaxID=1122208 RepID=A0A3D9KZI7_MARFU|nr:FG-GAP-like repeat-containing protein [Marinoscillum furvescens]RED95978.1 putative secreted protein (Por secretion system target) [Marinoscillum furvescens DSM 4134]
MNASYFKNTLTLFSALLCCTVTAQHFKDIQTQSKLSQFKHTNGIAVADYDLDKDLDIFATVVQHDNQNGFGAKSFLIKNNGDGSFSDATAISGIDHSFDYTGYYETSDFGIKMGASWGDYDNNGYPDLFLTSTFYNRLYRNNGNGTFSDVTAEMGFETTDECMNTGALWWDYNNDGYLDIFITKLEGCKQNRLYRNDINKFTEVTQETGIGGTSANNASWMSLPVDINEDGWLDLFVINDYHQANALYINHEGKTFSEQSASYGLNLPQEESMGVAMGDFDNNGKWDFYITNVLKSNFYVNNGQNHYSDLAAEYHITEAGWAWGTQFADFDHDTDEDLILVNGYGTNTANFLYKNMHVEQGKSFIDITSEANIDKPSDSKGVVAFDYDNDGDLDVLLSNTLDGLHFYENDLMTNEKPGTNWMKIHLTGVQSNSNGIGTKIELSTGSDTLYRFHHGANCLSQSLLPEHFGLGNSTEADFIRISWPSGEVDTYNNVPANSSIYATEDDGYVAVIDGFTKIAGCTDPNSCNYNPDATLEDGTCVYLTSEKITGKSVSGILREEVYSYPHHSESTYNWEIINGEILSGQHTSTVTVKWGIGDQGRISVTEMRECISQQVHLDVTMSNTAIPNDKSVARLWNEALLHAIRNDYARPTVHARNLFHVSAAMYDAWASLYGGKTYLLGQTRHGFRCPFDGFNSRIEQETAAKMTISYAAYRVLQHRFKNSPHASQTLEMFDQLFAMLSYDKAFESTDYSTGDPAALGNYIGKMVIAYGLQDGSSEATDYENTYYTPVNAPLTPNSPGNSTLTHPNRWQPLKLDAFIDQSGNPHSGTTPDFLSPEWGQVSPFALQPIQKTERSRNGQNFNVFFDPSSPPLLDTLAKTLSSEAYQWGFALVAIWSSHLDPNDGVMWDISPGGLGNLHLKNLPGSYSDYPNFYKLLDGGDRSTGHEMNPITNSSYEPQLVPRGDYTRVLAEFWADGPDSETPPGHWYVLLNYVSDHPDFVRKLEGKGPDLSPLEWDIKAYFTLGGAMHDAAIAAWSIKGFYDYIRPISAIRFMADLGQSTDSTQANYHVGGIPLIPNYIESVKPGDPLAGHHNEHVGKIKVYAWRGHDYIQNSQADQAGVGWILAENWWPYQRPSFVTPPFAGFVSGHSTFSRAAAEVLTLLTGSEYFPGGLGQFTAKKDEFLVFEQGPSQDITLEWATYRDASDQCSLSRIWGGIHPPADDLPGRIIGESIGIQAFKYAQSFFNSAPLKSDRRTEQALLVYPNPLKQSETLYIRNAAKDAPVTLYNSIGQLISIQNPHYDESTETHAVNLEGLPTGVYLLKIGLKRSKIFIKQ